MRVKDLEESLVYFPDDVNLFIFVDVRSGDPMEARRVFVDEIVGAKYDPEYGVILTLAGDWNDKETAQ